MKFRGNLYGIWVLVFALGLISCQSAKVTVLDQAPSFTLSSYKTFSFYETDATGALSENYERNMDYLKEEIAKHMAYRGLMRNDKESDLKINLGVVVEEKEQTRETNLATDPGTFNYIGQQRYTWKTEEIKVGSYRQGTVTVHLVDAGKNEAVWVGVSERILAEREDRLMQTIKDGVEEMFDNIP
jgi:hypothetical protein